MFVFWWHSPGQNFYNTFTISNGKTFYINSTRNLLYLFENMWPKMFFSLAVTDLRLGQMVTIIIRLKWARWLFLVCDWSVVTNPSFWLAKTYLWSSLIGQDRALPIPGHLSQVNVSKLGVDTGKSKIFSISRNVNTNSRQQQQQQQPLIASDIKFVNTARGTRGREKHNQIHV